MCIPVLIHVDVWQKPTQHCKAIILQLKIHKFFKKVAELLIEKEVPVYTKHLNETKESLLFKIYRYLVLPHYMFRFLVDHFRNIQYMYLCVCVCLCV